MAKKNSENTKNVDEKKEKDKIKNKEDKKVKEKGTKKKEEKIVKVKKEKKVSKNKEEKIIKKNKKDKIKDTKKETKEEKKVKNDAKKETKKEKKIKKDVRVDIQEEVTEEMMDEETSKAKYVFIYFFMTLMLIAILALLFIILNDRYSLIYKKPVATIELEEYGNIVVELDPTKAPNTVSNFVKLVEDGFYDGKVVYGLDAISVHFGRAKRGESDNATTSMVDKSIEVDSALDYEYEIDGEFENNNFKLNDINHEKYVLSLVRADYSDLGVIPQAYSYNSGAPQFKVLFDNAPGMNGNYAAFGKVIEGTEIIDELTKRKLESNWEGELNRYEKFVTIKSITVNTFGRKFKDVKLHKMFSPEEYFLQLFQNDWL